MSRSFIYELIDLDGNKMIGYCKEGRDPRPDLAKKRGLTGLEMDILGTFDVDEDPRFVGKIMPRILWYYYQTEDDDYILNINTPGESYAKKDSEIFGEDNIIEVYKSLVDKYEV
jgi:hypothetical protein